MSDFTRKEQPSLPQADEDVPTKELADILAKVHSTADAQMTELNPGAALEAIIEVVYQVSRSSMQHPLGDVDVSRLVTNFQPFIS